MGSGPQILGAPKLPYAVYIFHLSRKTPVLGQDIIQEVQNFARFARTGLLNSKIQLQFVLKQSKIDIFREQRPQMS